MTARVLPPVLPSELVSAVFAVGLVKFYEDIGLISLGVLRTAARHVPVPPARAAGLATALPTSSPRCRSACSPRWLHTLDLRDRMTARHCAAVARYAREIARAAGLPEEEQELVHTAGLLHDIGKFIFPDPILKGDSKLTDEDWEIVKMHPEQGAHDRRRRSTATARSREIILAHHERIDGNGYPRGLTGDEIPLLVADHLRRRHLRRDDRARLLPQAGLARRGDRASCAASPARSSTRELRRGLHRDLLDAQGRRVPPRRGRRLRRELQIERRVRAYARPSARNRVTSSRALRRAGARRLATAYTLAELSDSLVAVALALLVLDKTGSAFWTAAYFMVAKALPASSPPPSPRRSTGAPSSG